VAHINNPSYLKDRDQDYHPRPALGKSIRLYLKNKVKQKGLGVWLKW
jgi:hypothetical protein